MEKLVSEIIGKGAQYFRIKNPDQYFIVIKDYGPDYKNYLDCRKLLKLKDENIYYVFVGVPYKDIEYFVVRIDNINEIDWHEVGDKTEQLRWRGSKLDKEYIL